MHNNALASPRWPAHRSHQPFLPPSRPPWSGVRSSGAPSHQPAIQSTCKGAESQRGRGKRGVRL
eukprot:scaffold180583_cov35-Tisochrysis_lutea.AAC.1